MTKPSAIIAVIDAMETTEKIYQDKINRLTYLLECEIFNETKDLVTKF